MDPSDSSSSTINPTPSSAPRPMLAPALEAAEVHGIAVFRCQPRSKVPYPGSRGCLDATRDPKIIRAWWAEHPSANIGGATGELSDGLAIIDLDVGRCPKTGRIKDGPGNFARLVEQHAALGGFPDTKAALTPSGGRHLLVRGPGLRNSKSSLARDVDVRGAGGYFMVAGSIHPNGGQYEWDPTTLGTPVRDCPPWLRACLAAQAAALNEIEENLEFGEGEVDTAELLRRFEARWGGPPGPFARDLHFRRTLQQLKAGEELHDEGDRHGGILNLTKMIAYVRKPEDSAEELAKAGWALFSASRQASSRTITRGEFNRALLGNSATGAKGAFVKQAAWEAQDKADREKEHDALRTLLGKLGMDLTGEGA